MTETAKKPSMLKLTLSILFFVGLFGLAKFLGGFENGASTATDQRSERVKSILTDLQDVGVNISKDVTGPKGIMLFLDRQWQAITFNDVPESGETFYISAPYDKDYVELALWFHLPAKKNKESRLAVGQEISSLLTRSQFTDPRIRDEGLHHLKQAIENIDPNNNGEHSFIKGPFSIKLVPLQDRDDFFLVQLTIQGPI